MTRPFRLAPEDTVRLTAFARACKAAARAVVPYPPSHPAIATTLGRIVSSTTPPALTGSLKISVLPNALLLDGHAPAKPTRRSSSSRRCCTIT